MSITVAIPTHDRRETVLLAVRCALLQTRSPDAVVVLCDGCTDGTAQALRDLRDERVEVVELEKGAGYSYGYRNLVLDRARGPVVTWLADDDLWLPDHLERITARWDRDDVDLVVAPAVMVAPSDDLTWLARDWSVPAYRATLDYENANAMASVSVRAELVKAVGGWDAAVPRGGDWNLWRRILEAGARPAVTYEPTVLHFKATGREQSWQGRVAQNTAWFERLLDPTALEGVREAMRRARTEHEASLWSDLQVANRGWADADRGGAEAVRETARLHAELTAAHGHHAALLGELRRLAGEAPGTGSA